MQNTPDYSDAKV